VGLCDPVRSSGDFILLIGETMETLLNIAEVAAIVRLSEQTIRRYVLQREIPFHKIKKAVRFFPSEIEVWVINQGNIAADGAGATVKDGELFDFPEDAGSSGEVQG
jgi:excisionase family DNA binding protein